MHKYYVDATYPHVWVIIYVGAMDSLSSSMNHNASCQVMPWHDKKNR